MSKRPSFDSDTIIKAALAKCGKVTVTADECKAAKKRMIVVHHTELSTLVMLEEDFERWLDESPLQAPLGEWVAVEPPQ